MGRGHASLPLKIWALVFLARWFWNLSLQGNCLEDLLKPRFLVPTPRVYHSAGLGRRGAGFSNLPNKLPGGARAASQGTTL